MDMQLIKLYRDVFVIDAGDQSYTIFGDPEIGYAQETYRALEVVYAETPGQALDLFLAHDPHVKIDDGIMVYKTGYCSEEPVSCGIATNEKLVEEVLLQWEKCYDPR